MIVAVDIDGVLRDIITKINEVYKREYPSHNIKEIKEWGLHKSYPIGHGIYHFVFEKHAKEIFTYAKPYDYAVEFCRRLRYSAGYLILCSTQSLKCQKYTLEWLDLNNFEYDTIAFTTNKEIIRCDILLDDGVHNLEAIRSSGNETIPICFDRPWNKKWEGKRVSGYKEFIELVEDWEQQISR